jgi:ATP-dependent DNA helicase DinG
MQTARERIEAAFDRLAERPGYTERPDQRQLALLLSDLMETGGTGAIEAPTGLGKSLAGLIPALAHALSHGRRTVIATYTNVLAEQYWRQDLPLALELLGEPVECTLLMGRQRYACLAELEREAPERIDDLLALAPLGIESEIRESLASGAKLWRKIVAPPVCPARFCPHYDACYYYSARRNALKAMVIVTNHAVVLQDALMTRTSSEEDEARQGLFGSIDFLVLDEAHDLVSAATNALEYVLDGAALERLAGFAGRLEAQGLEAARFAGAEATFTGRVRRFREALHKEEVSLSGLGSLAPYGGILDVAPAELKEHPAVRRSIAEPAVRASAEVAGSVAETCAVFARDVEAEFKRWKEEGLVAAAPMRTLTEASRNYLLAIREASLGAEQVAKAAAGGVSYLGSVGGRPFLRHDLVDLRAALTELLWSRPGWAALSATLALDGSFEHFSRLTGASPALTEILPSPFDYSSAASLYLPPRGRLLDPTLARKEGREDEYHAGLAREVASILSAMGGRCLVLFHSRKEMEATFGLLPALDLPVYVQPRFGAGSVGSKFRGEIRSSLFALRSFWTGFDAPGETLSCVVLVRVPFEVPTDPPAIVRIATMQAEGRDAFAEHALPNAKLMIRQGVGRLIRRAGDRGVIALLDARLRTKAYGEEILANLPPGMRSFEDIADAVGWLGLDPRSGSSSGALF